jgi:hypothetical protein
MCAKEIGNLKYHHTHTPENDIARIMTPFEGIRRGVGHVSPYQILVRFFATIPSSVI